jgi:hypothetical protein
MTRPSGAIAAATTAAVLASAAALESRLSAQSVLVQLGLTETAARTLVLDEVKAPSLHRVSAFALTGTRAFLKLPASARGAAASALFAWAKAHVNSPAFLNAYAQHRKDVGADSRNGLLTVDEEVKKKIDSELAELAEVRKQAAAMPPEMAAKTLEALKSLEDNLRSPRAANDFRVEIEASRGRQSERDAALALRLPANPQALFGRRLREFLDATTNVDFSARTLSLNGGADGIVFLDRADRNRHWIWQLAVIVGPEATTAARAAAQAWLQEIER